MMDNIINVKSFDELYNWLKENHNSKKYIWVNAKRGKPNGKDFSYLDVVYCALCFGWIDSTCKNIDGVTLQKIMPRSKNAHWSYLNIARCEYLIKHDLMTEYGLKVMPSHYEEFNISQDILGKLQSDKEVCNNFNNFPILYQRIRIDNIEWARKDKKLFNDRLNKLIETTKQNKMYGEWSDYGRLN